MEYFVKRVWAFLLWSYDWQRRMKERRKDNKNDIYEFQFSDNHEG